MAARRILESVNDAGEELARLIVIALDGVASPHEVDALLALAFEEAGIDDVPDRPEELLFFTSGPLYDVAQQRLGKDRAESLLAALSPVLDRAWELDRQQLAVGGPDGDGPPETWELGLEGASALPSSGVVRKRSRVRCSAEAEEVSDTVPASDEPWTADEADAATTMAPSSAPGRATLPYMPALLLAEEGAPAVLVIDADDDARRSVARAFREQGYAVATAPDAISAARLMSRLAPAAVVADLETIAPDFEPLGPALEALFAELEPPPVVLLDDQDRGEWAEPVEALLNKPVDGRHLCEIVKRLIDVSRPPAAR